MLWSYFQPTTTSPKVKGTPEKLRETLELLGMDFSEFNKCKAHWNSKDEKKIATTPIWTSVHIWYDPCVVSLAHAPRLANVVVTLTIVHMSKLKEYIEEIRCYPLKLIRLILHSHKFICHYIPFSPPINIVKLITLFPTLIHSRTEQTNHNGFIQRTTYDQNGLALVYLPLGPSGHNMQYFMVWDLILWPSSLGTMPEQNSKMPPTTSITLTDKGITTQNTMNNYDRT